ncbi:alpha/beta hydrolase [Brachybacterium sp.]|uniref:alpha/beta fold hydrolase n=1 Tax=Brachybacterium sp. TaxID=1891286 RepID=UPI002ED09092
MTIPPPSLPAPDLVDLGGVPVATYEWGPEGGPSTGDLVLCHGTPWSAEVWAPLARALGARFRVHLWDMPGYGRSAQGSGLPVDLATQGERLARLLEHWGLDRPHLLAHDIGGAVALRAHLLEGAEYASLMLWDVVTLDPWGSPFFRLVAEHEEVFAALPAPLHAALVREYIVGAARRPMSAPQIESLLAPWITPTGRPAFYRQIASLVPEHTRPAARALGVLRCPVSIGWGEEDLWIPVEQARRLQDLLPGDPPVTVLPGVGHLAPLEAAGEVAEVVEDWLDTVP